MANEQGGSPTKTLTTMKAFIEVTIQDQLHNEQMEFIGENQLSGKVLLETTNIQCIYAADNGSVIILKTRRSSDLAEVVSECDYNKLKVEESYETIRAMLI